MAFGLADVLRFGCAVHTIAGLTQPNPRNADGIARAGESIFGSVVPGMDAVDASAVRTDFIGHGYFAASTSVIADLKQLLHDDAAPQSRRLVPAKLANLLYWVIPAADPAK